MSYEHLVYTKHGRVGHVLLNRPRQLNALNLKLQRELYAVVNEVDAG